MKRKALKVRVEATPSGLVQTPAVSAPELVRPTPHVRDPKTGKALCKALSPTFASPEACSELCTACKASVGSRFNELVAAYEEWEKTCQQSKDAIPVPACEMTVILATVSTADLIAELARRTK